MNAPDDRRHIHERIKQQAAAIQAQPLPRVADLDKHPDLQALLNAAMEAVEAVLPAGVEFEGRRYWLRVRVLADLALYDAPGNVLPMVRVYSGGRWTGHTPGH